MLLGARHHVPPRAPQAGGAPRAAIRSLRRRQFRSAHESGRLIDDMRAEWLELDRRIAALRQRIRCTGPQATADARRLASIPGIGVLNATASRSPRSATARRSLGGATLRRGSGLVPRKDDRRQAASGRHHQARQQATCASCSSTAPGRLCRRSRPVHAARRLAAPPDARVHKNAAVVALANKLARIAWATLQRNQDYDVGMGAEAV